LIKKFLVRFVASSNASIPCSVPKVNELHSAMCHFRWRRSHTHTAAMERAHGWTLPLPRTWLNLNSQIPLAICKVQPNFEFAFLLLLLHSLEASSVAEWCGWLAATDNQGYRQ